MAPRYVDRTLPVTHRVPHLLGIERGIDAQVQCVTRDIQLPCDRVVDAVVGAPRAQRPGVDLVGLQRVRGAVRVDYDPAAEALRTAIAEMLKVDITPELPDLSQSLRALQVRQKLLQDIAPTGTEGDTEADAS